MKSLAHFIAVVLLLITVLPAMAQDGYACEENLVEVLFQPEARVRLMGDDLVDLQGNATEGLEGILMQFPAWSWARYTLVPEPEVDVMVEEARINSGQEIYDLNNIYRLRIEPGGDMHLLAMDLEALPGVMRCYAVPLAQEAPTPDFQPQQGYLAPAQSIPAGVAAAWSWTQAGGNGNGVTVCDLEYSWNTSHQDISKAAGSQLITAPIVDPFSDNNHGTAVIGELVADANGWGVTGVCPGAGLLTCATNYGSPASWNVPGAITQAASVMTAGDVILLEQQWEYTPYAGDFVPVEWWGSYAPYPQTMNAVYVAIQTAVALGINVVEAGGNGSVDTDLMSWVGDSGAIIVGAGAATSSTDRQRLSFSSYGSRFNVQGWGENVVTCGYGDLHGSEGVNRWFTSTFNGTSSASPIIAGCVANAVGHALAQGAAVPTPAMIRTLLATGGSPQVTPPLGYIGPRPDLAAVLAGVVPTMFTDITAGIMAGQGGSITACWGDYDQDQDPDLLVANSTGPNDLMRNDMAGPFMPTPPSFIHDPGPASDAAWADFDGDGDLDAYLVNNGLPNLLLTNDGGDNFTDITMPPLDDPSLGECADWADVDGDGDLDLYVGNGNGMVNRLFLNNGGGPWLDVTVPPLDDPNWTKDVQFCDYDRDGDADLYIANLAAPDRLLQNDGSGQFVDVTPPPCQIGINTISASWGDFNNDGWPDLYLVHYMHANRLLLNQGGLGFLDVTTAPVDAPGYGHSAAWGDLDNDGRLDLYLVRSTGANVLLQNQVSGFVDVTAAPVNDSGAGSAAGWADADRDGDLDLYLANNGAACRMMRNDVGSYAGHWLQIDLAGTGQNTHGVGARVEVYTAAGLQVREVGVGAGRSGENPLMLHFGLGSHSSVDSVRVHWPSGATCDSVQVSADQRMVMTEPPLTPVLDDQLPRCQRLHPAAPNPFNPATCLRFELPRPQNVHLAVYDLSGRRVRTLLAGERRSAGRHDVTWRGCDDAGRRLASGTYVARLEAGGEVQTRLMVMVK